MTWLSDVATSGSESFQAGPPKLEASSTPPPWWFEERAAQEAHRERLAAPSRLVRKFEQAGGGLPNSAAVKTHSAEAAYPELTPEKGRAGSPPRAHTQNEKITEEVLKVYLDKCRSP